MPASPSPFPLLDLNSISNNNNNDQQTLSASTSPPLIDQIETKLNSIEYLKAKLEYTLIKIDGKKKKLEFSNEFNNKTLKNNNNENSIGDSTESFKREYLVNKLEGIKLELEFRRGTCQLKQIILNALDSSHASAINMCSTGVTRETSAFLSRKSVIDKRDDLALALSRVRNEIDSLSTERTVARKRLLVLNRENATLVKALKPDAVVDLVMNSLSKELDARCQEELSKLKESQSRHSIARNIFQLLVLESGVDWYILDDGVDTPTGDESDTSVNKRMGNKELLKYMMEPMN